jgi:hypothetical protein
VTAWVLVIGGGAFALLPGFFQPGLVNGATLLGVLLMAAGYWVSLRYER